MYKTQAKEITKLQLAGLLVGTGLEAFGFFIPGLSWKGGFWITLPWIVRTFFVIASTGFKDGIPASIGWLLLYSLPILPASAGTYVGGLTTKLISSIRKG